MTKSEFQALFKQVKEKMHKSNLIGGAFNDETKEKLGLNDNNKTIPFDRIFIDTPIKYVPNKEKNDLIIHYYPGEYTDAESKSHKYKNEDERIIAVRKANTVNKKHIDKWERLRKKHIQKQLLAHQEKNNPSDKKISAYSISFTSEEAGLPRLPPLFPEYPVCIELKRIRYKIPSINIDNKILFDVCLKNRDGKNININETAKQWNKTVLEDYKEKGKESQKYKKYAEVFKEWFFDNGINIEDVEVLESKRKTTKNRIPENIIKDRYPDAKWEDVYIKTPANTKTIKGNSQIGIKYKGENYTYLTFRELDLINKNETPKREWIVFATFVLREVPKIRANKTGQKGYISKIRTILKTITGIDDDPFLPYENFQTWKPKFKLTSFEEIIPREYNDEIDYMN